MQCWCKTHDLEGRKSPSGSIISTLSPSPYSPSYLCPFQTGHIQNIFHPTIRLCLAGHTFNLKGSLSSYTSPLTSTDWCVTVCMCLCMFMSCWIHFLHSCQKLQVSESGGTLCFYWQITVGSPIMCLLDTLSNRQKIGLNICLAPLLLLLHECRPSSSDCFWQWQQEQAAWEDFSEDLPLYLHRKVRWMSQIKQEKAVFSQLLWNFSGQRGYAALKMGYHLTSSDWRLSIKIVWY